MRKSPFMDGYHMAEWMAWRPTFVWERVLLWTVITWPSEWFEGQLLHKKEFSYGWLLHSWMNGLKDQHLWMRLLDGRVNCLRADNEWIWRQTLLMSVHIYNENTHRINEWGEERKTKETPMEERVGGKKSLSWPQEMMTLSLSTWHWWNHGFPFEMDLF